MHGAASAAVERGVTADEILLWDVPSPWCCSGATTMVAAAAAAAAAVVMAVTMAAAPEVV